MLGAAPPTKIPVNVRRTNRVVLLLHQYVKRHEDSPRPTTTGKNKQRLVVSARHPTIRAAGAPRRKKPNASTPPSFQSFSTA